MVRAGSPARKRRDTVDAIQILGLVAGLIAVLVLCVTELSEGKLFRNRSREE